MADKRSRDVLIINNEKDVREVIKMYCHNMGVFRNISIAKDGIDASSKLMNQKYSLILLDLNIPNKNSTYFLIDSIHCEIMTSSYVIGVINFV